MRDLKLIKEIIDEVSTGEHFFIYEPMMDSITVIIKDTEYRLEGETTLELWCEYKKICGAEKKRLRLVL